MDLPTPSPPPFSFPYSQHVPPPPQPNLSDISNMIFRNRFNNSNNNSCPICRNNFDLYLLIILKIFLGLWNSLGCRPGDMSLDMLQMINLSNNTDLQPSTHYPKEFRILQWNCNGICSRLPSLLGIAYKYSVICCQETLLNQGKNFSLKNFNLFRHDISLPGSRGVLLAVADHLLCSPINLCHIQHPSIEIVGVELQTETDKIAIFLVYRHPNTFTPLSIMTDIFDLSKRYNDVIFLGNFNAHCMA